MIMLNTALIIQTSYTFSLVTIGLFLVSKILLLSLLYVLTSVGQAMIAAINPAITPDADWGTNPVYPLLKRYFKL